MGSLVIMGILSGLFGGEGMNIRGLPGKEKDYASTQEGTIRAVISSDGSNDGKCANPECQNCTSGKQQF